MTPDDFTRWVEPHLDVLHRLSRRLCSTRADAEDLAQEALVRAYEKRATLRDPGKARAWLLALLRNLHLNRVRSERPHLVLLPSHEPTSDLEEEIQNKVLPDELLLALRELPEEQASAIWLREVEGLSYEELAVAMDTPIGTVRSRLARARMGLLEKMEAHRARPNLQVVGGSK